MMSTYQPVHSPPSASPTAAHVPFNLRGIRAATLIRILLICLALFILIYVFIARPYHMRWGATDSELTMPLPGDVFIPSNAVTSTRALTIQASPSEIWPWIAQTGQGRGGWHSYFWLENNMGANMEDVDAILPQYQDIQVGDELPFTEGGSGPTAARVTLVEPEKALVLGDGWTLFLQPIDDETTRLIVRYYWPLEEGAMDKFFYYAVAEPWHFIMESGMMLGIKQKAEGGTQ